MAFLVYRFKGLQVFGSPNPRGRFEHWDRWNCQQRHLVLLWCKTPSQTLTAKFTELIIFPLLVYFSNVFTILHNCIKRQLLLVILPNFKFYLSEVSEWYSRSPSYQRRKWCLLVITEVLLKPGSLFQWPSEVIKNLSIWFIEEKCRSKRTDFIAWTAALPLTCRRTSRPRSTETRSGRAGLWKTTPTLSLPPMSTSSMPERTLLQPTLTRWIW